MITLSHGTVETSIESIFYYVPYATFVCQNLMGENMINDDIKNKLPLLISVAGTYIYVYMGDDKRENLSRDLRWYAAGEC